MADVKWIKITVNIFNDEKILLIESLPDADAIIVMDSGKYEMHISTLKTSAGCRIVPMLDAVRKGLLEEKKQQKQRKRKHLKILKVKLK